MARRARLDISDSMYDLAIRLREEGKPKTDQCKALGIPYNTTRLESLLTDYLNNKERSRLLKEKKKLEPVTPQEVSRWCTEYVLEGRPLAGIASSSYRPVGIVKYHLDKEGALVVRRGIDKLESAALPDIMVADEFSVGQLVWVAPYGCIGEVRGAYKNAYRVYVFGEGIQEYSYQPPYELGDLSHLEALGVNLRRAYDSCLTPDQCASLIREALEKLFKSNKKGNQ
jgi:hypothetical protein